MSVILVLVTSIKAEYKWNGSEWIWEETPTNANSDGSGDYESADEDQYNGEGDYDDEDYSEGSGDDRQYGTQVNTPPPRSNNNNRNNNNNNQGSNNWQDNVQITPTPETPYDPNADVGRDWQPDNGEDIIVDPPQTTFASPVDNNNIINRNNDRSKTRPSFFAQPGTMVAVIGGAVVGLLCAILCVMFVVYRMRKKDEGSYALDEPKRSPTVNSYSKPPSREFYA